LDIFFSDKLTKCGRYTYQYRFRCILIWNAWC